MGVFFDPPSLYLPHPLSCLLFEGGFTERDEVLIENLAVHSGIVLRNAQMYESARTSESKVSFLFTVIEAIQSSDDINQLIYLLATESNKLVNADRSDQKFLPPSSFGLFSILLLL